jgi:hypothetical protein
MTTDCALVSSNKYKLRQVSEEKELPEMTWIKLRQVSEEKELPE